MHLHALKEGEPLATMPVKELHAPEADVRSYAVTISQICEDCHVYYRAAAPDAGRGALAYGHTPEAALAKLYDEVMPRLMSYTPRSTAAFISAENR